MNNKIRSRKLSRRRNTSRRKGSLKKKSKMMKGGLGYLPKEQTGIDVIFYISHSSRALVHEVAGAKQFTIRADFGARLEKTLYTLYIGGQIAFGNETWKNLKGLTPKVGSVSENHFGKHGNKLHFSLSEHNYTRNDFNRIGSGGGITQIIHKIYNLKDRLCEYYGIKTD